MRSKPKPKKKQPPEAELNWVPMVGEEQFMSWLPRDIKAGWTEDTPKGTLFMGWNLTSDTLQLWETISTGPEAKARFVGFICRTWDGGTGL